MNFLKLSLASLLMLSFPCITNAQPPAPIKNSNVSELPALKSPNGGSLGKFGDIPVSPYIGSPSITIPLTEIENGSIKVPIYLQYDPGGCRPDDHPTWVGLNWSLNAGGVVTRKANGRPDEQLLYETASSYFDKYYLNASSQWNQTSYLQPLFSTAPDRAPDQFSFSFNGISGSFFFNEAGQWKVKSKEGINLKIVCQTSTTFRFYDPYNNYFDTPRVITEFTITTDDGTQYIFGREGNAIELSMPALFDGDEDFTSLLFHSGPAESCAWHMSEIISPNGQHVKFTYTTDYSFKQVVFSETDYPDEEENLGYQNWKTKFLTTTPYLLKIEGDNGVSCEFTKSPSNELKSIFFIEPTIFTAHAADFNRYGLIRANKGQYHKLDNITVRSKFSVFKSVKLGYIENPNERLKLKNVQTSTYYGGDAINAQYTFEYNPSLLPPYNVSKEDHWGFYNGKNYYTTENGSDVVNHLNDYYESRQPNATLMQSEILTKITYPTKGYTLFYFEPHDYSSVVLRAPSFQLSTRTYNSMAGGLRIKKLEDYDAISSTPITKEYFYTKNYINGGTLSSGILASNPTYYYAGEVGGDYNFSLFNSHPIGYLNYTNGNHITYTEVTEKSSNGYTVNTFANQDNGYMDKPAFASVFHESTAYPYERIGFNSLELERGLTLSTKYYAADKFLLKEINNTYNNDPSRYNSYVRSIQFNTFKNSPPAAVTAYGIYTFYPYLKNSIEKEYFRAGGNLVTTKDFVYDPLYNHIRKITSTTSEGNKLITTYTYPYNYSNGDPNSTATINVMVARNILNKPIEVATFIEKSGVQSLIDSKLTIYNTFNGFTLPYQQYSIAPKQPITDFQLASASLGSTIVKDSRYVLNTTFEKYDSKGNILQYTNNSGTNSFIWGYNQSLPIAEIKNATAAQIAYNGVELGVSPGQQGWEEFNPTNSISDFDTKDQTASFAGVYSVKIDAAPVGGMNFGTTINVTPGANSKEKYKMSCWIKTPVGYTSDKAQICMYTIKANSCCGGYPATSPVARKFIPATNGTWQYFETYLDLSIANGLLTPAEQGMLLSIRAFSANTDNNYPVYIDEVRIHPVDALMKTYAYNYNPQVGISAILDENNQIANRFEYDVFSKLKVVRDKDNNIVKKINYRYKNNYIIKCEGFQGKSNASYDFIAPNDALRECTPGGNVSYYISADFSIKINGVIRTLPYTGPDGTTWTKVFDREYYLNISTINGNQSFSIIFNN